MQVILLERITNLGSLGDEVNVKNGYARNFLIPQHMALRATDENRQYFEEQRAELDRLAIEKLEGAQKRAAQLEGKTITYFARVAEGGRLYGSVGPIEIARILTSEGVEVHKSEIRMPTGVIRETGEYEVDVQVHADIVRSVTVIIEEE